jgi:hypothetical protein
MEVDHYDPTKKADVQQDYYNLLLATRHCNGSKSSYWPNAEQLKKGLYIINPCVEQDYGNHIYEDPLTHRLWGCTPTGIWHIRYLDLNATHLVNERKDRYNFNRQMNREPKILKGRGWINLGLPEQIKTLRQRVDLMIPEWPQKPAPLGYKFI